MLRIHVLFFARGRELAGCSEMEQEMEDGSNSQDLLEAVIARFPALAEISSCLIVAVNQNYEPNPVPLKDGDEVALIPPISGG